MIIAVIGGHDMDTETGQIAEQLGACIARRGHLLVCGGMGGVMEAACRGAKKHAGTTIGILPGKSRRDANRFVDIPIVTAMSHARNAIIVRTADAVVAVGGKYGTLSEIGLARAIDRVVVGLRTWDIEGIIPVKSPEEAVAYIEEHAL